MALPPGYEYVETLAIPVISLCCHDPSHEPAHVAFFGWYRRPGLWALMRPRGSRLKGSPLYTAETLAAINPQTNSPTTGSDFVERYNLKCSQCRYSVVVRQVDRLYEILDQLDAVGNEGQECPEHADLRDSGVVSMPLASLAAKLPSSGTR